MRITCFHSAVNREHLLIASKFVQYIKFWCSNWVTLSHWSCERSCCGDYKSNHSLFNSQMCKLWGYSECSSDCETWPCDMVGQKSQINTTVSYTSVLSCSPVHCMFISDKVKSFPKNLALLEKKVLCDYNVRPAKLYDHWCGSIIKVLLWCMLPYIQ